MNAKKLISLLLALVMVFSLVACNNSDETSEPTESTENTQPTETTEVTEPVKTIFNSEYGVDYVGLYETFGKDVTIADVVEDTSTGLCYATFDGVEYELGMDFLSRAMVYNTTVPEGGEWADEDAVYAEWWKLYIQRWNYLLPEVPLYSNEYYDLYNAEIKGVTEYPTNPYWSPSDALIDWTSEKADGSIILGNTTELSGKFRYANFASSNPGAADLDIQDLIVGMETVSSTKEGGYVWNDTIVAEHNEVDNEDGTRTITIKLNEGLKFSDGSPVTAKNYVVLSMVFSTPVAAQAAGKDHMGGMALVGYDDFAAYNGVEGTKEFSGIRLLDELTFSVTISSDYMPYFYAITYGSFSAQPLSLWIGDCDIADDGNGAYFTGDFYAMEGDTYVMADHVYNGAWNTNADYPYSGPYTIESWDEADKSVVLKANPNFPGNYEGTKPAIETVVYKLLVSSTQMADFTSGGVDVIAGITGGDETKEAIAIADAEPTKYVYTHYSRAGYGKLGFRADYGPARFLEVRQAIAYCMDRATFAKDFTGGYGGVVDGPYYTGSWMYKAAEADGMTLNAYATSVDSAIAVLEEGGWIYNAEGGEYTDGVRYKKLSAAEATENDINYQSKDGAYKTTKVGDDYYLPLVLNWYGTSDNPFTDLLVTGFMENENIKNAGFVVQSTVGDFGPMLDELYQAAVYGFYAGTPMYACFNFATGFTSAVYDYALAWSLEPTEFDNYSACYLKDEADAYWLDK